VEVVFVDANTGLTTACGMTPDTPRVVCTGNALDGRRGLTDEDFGAAGMPPISFAVRAEPPLELFETISVGEAFACGATRSDNAFCWGDNGTGQLGTLLDEGDASPDALKVQFNRGTVRVHAVAAGANYACAVTTDDEGSIEGTVSVQCRGDNTFGQSGTECDDGRGTPACEGPAPRPVVIR
jgi:hypothetical protein